MKSYLIKAESLFLMTWLVSASINATVYNGECGDSLQWSFNDEIGLLEIYGTYPGEPASMSDYSHFGSGNVSPWYKHKDNIQIVAFSDVSSIGKYAFLDCSNLTSISVPDGVTTIGYAAFSGCKGLTTLTIPESVTKIDQYAFSGCTGELILKSRYIPGGKRVASTYNGWDGLSCSPILEGSKFSSIKVNGFLGDYTFAHLSTIQTIEANGGFSRGAFHDNFYDCSAKTLILNCSPHGFNEQQMSTNIGGTYDSYLKGTKFTHITINCDSICNYSCHDLNLNIIELGENVRIIGEGAFYNCEGSSITIPSGVTTIGDMAFYSCNGNAIQNNALTSINIPISVSRIGTKAFHSCFKMTEVSAHNPIPPICAEDAFGSSPYGNGGAFRNAVLYVPTGSLEDYKSAQGWRNFVNIQEKDFEDGIHGIMSNKKNNNSVFNLAGIKQTKQNKGISIILQSDGTSKKVLKR